MQFIVRHYLFNVLFTPCGFGYMFLTFIIFVPFVNPLSFMDSCQRFNILNSGILSLSKCHVELDKCNFLYFKIWQSFVLISKYFTLVTLVDYCGLVLQTQLEGAKNIRKVLNLQTLDWYLLQRVNSSQVLLYV